MTHDDILNMIIPRQFVPEIEDLDPTNMEFWKFINCDDLIECKFTMFSSVFLKKLSTQNETVYEILMCDDLTFREKFDYLKSLEMYDSRNNVYDYYVNIPLVYKKNNICKFNYIFHENSNPNRKMYIRWLMKKL